MNNPAIFRNAVTMREARAEVARTELDALERSVEASEQDVRARVARLPLVYNLVLGPLDREISSFRAKLLSEGHKLPADSLKAYHIALHHLERVRGLCGVPDPVSPASAVTDTEGE